jgi:predicted nuclease of predicted toxin-antitoxin system
MDSPKFLFDINIPAKLVKYLRKREPAIDLVCVGDLGAPPKQTKDPNLLLAAETMGRFVIALDKKSLPGHLMDHFSAGNDTAGVAMLRNGFTNRRYADEILLIWGASSADEWRDCTIYIP